MSAPGIDHLLVSHWRMAWSLDVEAASAATLYLAAAVRLRGRWPIRRTASFLAGVGCIVAALQSGIDAYDDQLLSVHMVQHMLLLMLAPLLLLGGRPAILLLRALPSGLRARPARVVTGIGGVIAPLRCLGVFYVVVIATHLPTFYDAALRHPVLHVGEHMLYLLTGLLLWWPLLDADPGRRGRLSGLGKLGYLVGAMPPMAAVGAYVNRLPTLLYPAYGPPAHALGVSAVVDQQQAGAIMWVGGSVIMVAIGLWVAIAALLEEERRQRTREARASVALGPGGSAAR